MSPTAPLSLAELEREAARLGLTSLGTPPRDLPDVWLESLEAAASRLQGAYEASEYEMLLGRPVANNGLHKELFHRYIHTPALEAACRDRLPHEEGARQGWLGVLLQECIHSRLSNDLEIRKLTDRIETLAWGFQPAPTPPGADPRESARLRASATVPLAAQLRPMMLRLVQRRNELARQEGHANYHALRSAHQGAPEHWHLGVLDELLGHSAPAMRRLVGWLSEVEGRPVREIWQLRGALRAHGAVPRDRLPTPSLGCLGRLDVALGLGSSDTPIDLQVLPFAAGGLCSIVDSSNDVRIVVADWLMGSGPQAVLMHEYGHARHAIAVGRTSHPFHVRALMKGEPAPLCEGLAMLFESISEEPGWIEEMTRPTPAELDGWRRHARFRRTLGTSVELCDALFERALYEDPDGDLDGVQRRLGREVLGLELQEEASLWAANPLLVSMPAHNLAYVLAELFAQQVREALGGQVWRNPEVGPYLQRHFYRPAGSLPWRERLRQATGADLGVAPLAALLAEAR